MGRQPDHADDKTSETPPNQSNREARGRKTKGKKVDRTEFRPTIQPGYPDAVDLDEGRR